MPLTTSLRVSVRIGDIIEHEEAVRRVAEKAKKDKPALDWIAYQIYAGEGGLYFYTSQAEIMAEILARETTPAMVLRLFGEKNGTALLKQINQGVESIQTLAFQPREDLSCAAEPSLDQPAPFVLRSRIRVCRGGQRACEELLRKVTEAVSKVDDERRFTTLQTVLGDAMEYSIVQLIHDPTQLDRERRVPDLLNAAYGAAEGGALLNAGRDAIDSIQVDLSIHRPDLSSV